MSGMPGLEKPKHEKKGAKPKGRAQALVESLSEGKKSKKKSGYGSGGMKYLHHD